MRFAWIFIAVLAVYWCSENSTNVILDNQSSVLTFYQIPGCLQTPLFKTGTPNQGCFEYDFEKTLKLEFCLPANCCPDTARFNHEYLISDDTIYFTVLDTAQDLCNCICIYKIQTEISDLLKDAYIFQCLYYDSTVYETLVYRDFD